MERLIDKETAILAKKMNYLWDCDYYYMENSRTLFHCHRAVNNNVLGDMKYAAECRLRGAYMCTVKIEWDEPL